MSYAFPTLDLEPVEHGVAQGVSSRGLARYPVVLRHQYRKGHRDYLIEDRACTYPNPAEVVLSTAEALTSYAARWANHRRYRVPKINTVDRALVHCAARRDFPYCVHPAGPPGMFLLLNRDYVPVGLPRPEYGKPHIDYATYTAHHLPEAALREVWDLDQVDDAQGRFWPGYFRQAFEVWREAEHASDELFALFKAVRRCEAEHREWEARVLG